MTSQDRVKMLEVLLQVVMDTWELSLEKMKGKVEQGGDEGSEALDAGTYARSKSEPRSVIVNPINQSIQLHDEFDKRAETVKERDKTVHERDTTIAKQDSGLKLLKAFPEQKIKEKLEERDVGCQETAKARKAEKANNEALKEMNKAREDSIEALKKSNRSQAEIIESQKSAIETREVKAQEESIHAREEIEVLKKQLQEESIHAREEIEVLKKQLQEANIGEQKMKKLQEALKEFMVVGEES
ncbi:hypothetical protein BU25DRAFT_461331 [Macroventuria anomochaeta]|uniref:Uncharacterized protein n=1 Tax=Macroventuria anomochaeta TaxID=301207 RepID=A0ACB6RQT0_9PLEO|nr:uncharacterized protein BU25DRAFT_461331 [Macroventuria anomochaeta]KAF2624139.1 hypothetical protein BU25DRAFT_461331 [Macroventuria anomochaeta]